MVDLRGLPEVADSYPRDPAEGLRGLPGLLRGCPVVEDDNELGDASDVAASKSLNDDPTVELTLLKGNFFAAVVPLPVRAGKGELRGEAFGVVGVVGGVALFALSNSTAEIFFVDPTLEGVF